MSPHVVKGSAPVVAHVGPEPEALQVIQIAPEVQKSSPDPRMKLLTSLQSKGLLSGEQERKRHLKDLYAYPDITALAHVAKTKETFHEIMGSPKLIPLASPQQSPQQSPLSMCLVPEWISPQSTPLTSISSIGPPENLDLDDVDLLQPLERSVDPQRTDLLWNLAGHGTPRIEPLASDELETDGSTKTGVYLLRSPAHRPSHSDLPFRSIFKPLDEEVFERRGIEPGSGAVREEAAFVIDRLAGGQAHVPVTARASVEHKRGSLQEFVEGACGPVENFGMPRDLPKAKEIVGIDEAQAVACFDIRVFNTDRHAGNLLLAGPKPHRIVCIDHGCVLPAWWALDMARFDAWADWPHVAIPPTPATLELVTQIGESLPRVVQELEKLDIGAEAIWTMRICTSLLQEGVLKHGLSLRRVSLLMTRADPSVPSWLERRVEAAVLAAGYSADFVPESKYGDLVFRIDKRLTKYFEGVQTSPAEVKSFKAFEWTFFNYLQGEFAAPVIRTAAALAEEAMQPPWSL
jgi:hypothetical protein